MLGLGYLAPASLHSLYRCNLHFQPFLGIHQHKLDETTHHSHHHIAPSLPVEDKEWEMFSIETVRSEQKQTKELSWLKGEQTIGISRERYDFLWGYFSKKEADKLIPQIIFYHNVSTTLGLLGTLLPHEYLGFLVRQKHDWGILDKKETSNRAAK